MYNLCESVFLELRPRLQSVNVFVKLKKDYNVGELDVQVEDDRFILEHSHERDVIVLGDHDVVKNSLSISYRNAEDSYLCFRFSTDCSYEVGSFRAEFLRPKKQFASTFGSNAGDKLHVDSEYVFRCSHCDHLIVDNDKGVQFKRILPLPSENVSAKDWFCHHHKSEGDDSHVDHDTTSLLPRDDDLLYSTIYILVNNKRFTLTHSNDNYVSCSKCGTKLGSIMEQDTLKLWLHNITLTDTNLFTLKWDNISTILLLLTDVINDPFKPTPKLLLKCGGSKDYLFIWVIEKKLSVRFGDLGGDVAKVMYKNGRIGDSASSEWMNDLHISISEVSRELFQALRDHLATMSEFMPSSFRKQNMYLVSFLKVYQ